MIGQRWKELYEMERVKKEQLDGELKEARDRLESDMELAYQDYQTQMLREDLERRQQELERMEAAKRERMEIARRREEERMNAMSGLGGGSVPMGMGGGAGPMHMVGGIMRGPGHPEEMSPFFGGVGLPQHGGMGGDFGNPFVGPPGGGRGLICDGPGRSGPFIGGAGPSPGGRPDPNLVQGVQKLLQMFKGGPGDGPKGQQNGPPPPPPPDQTDGRDFFGGPMNIGMPPGNGSFDVGRGGFAPLEKRRRH